MRDLLLALAGGITLDWVPGVGYRRSDGVEVFTEDVKGLIRRDYLRRSGPEVVELGRWTKEILATKSSEQLLEELSVSDDPH